jgi:NTP pyrophosphatase (non-canonical NTP hydrolase)
VKSIDTELINKTLNQFIKERDWDQFHSPKNLAMALSVECSELVEQFQWVTERQSEEMVQDPKSRIKMEEEIADIFIYLLRIATKAGIDIQAAALKKIQKNADKYPVEKAKGSAKKYDEL